jgi:hypothetical protein
VTTSTGVTAVAFSAPVKNRRVAVRPAALRLIESVSYSKGTLHLTYEPAGEPTYGEIG